MAVLTTALLIRLILRLVVIFKPNEKPYFFASDSQIKPNKSRHPLV